ncbi:adenylate kinase family protein [Infirmifilum lucidum]|uniref:Putative adenylate kinase n=1 Tax=Infirmifilum lucidum TaxID=2776706 RepID=A0A7L9FGD5_9CREN|nr:adenylate kinase family protein [Infirmifilum lucidum]QOJ78083.1 adenylate kinase family protein [Infirmifilum lucidum]
MAILITGTPGVGKTTIARLLAERTGKKYIDFAEVVKNERLYAAYDPETNSYVVNLDRARSYMEQLLSCEEILDTHLVEALPPDKVSVAIVLRLDPLVLRERLNKRGYPSRKIRENIESEILDAVLISAIENLGEEKVFEVDTTGKTIAEIIEIITQILNKNGKLYKPGRVDWLEKYYFLIGKEGGII